MQNYFTQKAIPNDFATLKYDQTVTVDNTQIAFYRPGVTDKTAKTRPITGCALAPTGADAKEERDFLDKLGLLLVNVTDRKEYIHPDAETAFYKSGLFITGTKAALKGKPLSDQALLTKEALIAFRNAIEARILWISAIGKLSSELYTQEKRTEELSQMKAIVAQINSQVK